MRQYVFRRIAVTFLMKPIGVRIEQCINLQKISQVANITFHFSTHFQMGKPVIYTAKHSVKMLFTINLKLLEAPGVVVECSVCWLSDYCSNKLAAIM